MLFAFIFFCSFQKAGFSSLKFISVDKKVIAFSDLAQKKGILFLYLMPDCPFCIKYAKTFREISKEYCNKGISIIGVIPGGLYTEKEAKDYIRAHKLDFPFIIDSEKQLTRLFKVEVSPSAVVSNGKGELLYKGLIDNWPVRPGQNRQVITENYVKDVLKQISEGKNPSVKNTEAVGCIIE